MKTIDKLREAATYNPAFSDNATRIVCNYLSEIEAEIADNYTRLPVDADGVPIHVGDELFNKNKPTDVYKVTAIADNGYIRIYHDTAHIHSSQCRHVKPRTLEDVLVDMLEAAVGYSDAHTDVSLVAVEKYADEIRELLGGDAESKRKEGGE